MGGKGKISEKDSKLDEEEAKKREEDARRIAQEAESQLKNEEQEKKRDAEEVVRKEEEELKKKEEVEIKKKQEEREGLRLKGSQKDQHTTEQVDTQKYKNKQIKIKDNLILIPQNLLHLLEAYWEQLPFLK